jgi:hypothetical protein
MDPRTQRLEVGDSDIFQLLNRWEMFNEEKTELVGWRITASNYLKNNALDEMELKYRAIHYLRKNKLLAHCGNDGPVQGLPGCLLFEVFKYIHI